MRNFGAISKTACGSFDGLYRLFLDHGEELDVTLGPFYENRYWLDGPSTALLVAFYLKDLRSCL